MKTILKVTGKSFANSNPNSRFWFALSALAIAISANAQAPANIQGKTFGMGISNGTSPFANNGYYLFLPTSSGLNYQIVGIHSVTSSSGTYTYNPSGSAILNNTIPFSLTIGVTFNFNTAYTGSYAASGGGGNQSGQFEMYAGTALSSIAGKKVYCSISDGSFPFASFGTALMTINAAGSSYTITALSGNVASR